MKTVLRTIVVLGLAGIVAAGLVVFLGLYNVSARQGHVPGVSWVLHTTFSNSVKLRAPPEDEVPALTDDMAALGAKHFDTGCRPCHGAPGEQRMAAARSMLPEPPHITDAIAAWEPNELFWIVREGAKMTGMPAFPAPRDDEVWAVVAFLTRSAQMTAADYADLTAYGDVTDGPVGASYCAMCHGPDGRSDNPEIPRLDIQNPQYLAHALEAYRTGSRQSGIMQQAASLYSAGALGDLATYFAAQEPTANSDAADPAGPGLKLASEGTGDVPACRACHGPSQEARNPLFPDLAGQSEPYLNTQLKLWRDGTIAQGQHSELMQRAAAELTDADIAALAAYYAGLAP